MNNPVENNYTRLSDEVKAALQIVSTATLTTQLMARGFRNTFLHGLTTLNPKRQRMVGEAFTMRTIPAREDIDVLAVYQDYDHPQRVAIESLNPGQVLVIDSRQEPRAASLGNILATRVYKRGGAGIVTDGSVRDAKGFAGIDLPSFSNGASPTTNLALHHVADFQLPIGCAGVPIYPGDIMVGDEDGVICVPAHVVEEVALAGVKQDHLEDFILAKIESGSPLRGTYPPNEQVRAEYEEYSKNN